MSINVTPSYVRELERLIKEELFPIYKRYYRETGKQPKYVDIDFDTIIQVQKTNELPVLLRQ